MRGQRSDAGDRLSRPAAHRLSLYLRSLAGWPPDGGKISSGRIAEACGVSDAQVRRDLAALGHLGQRGIGYEAKDLAAAIRAALGINRTWQAVLVVYTIMCVGFALLFGPLFTLSLGSIEPRFYSHGSAILGSIQQVAGAAGVALLISVMSATQAANLAGGADAAAALSAGIRASFLIAAIVSLLAVATTFLFRKPEPQPQLQEKPKKGKK